MSGPRRRRSRRRPAREPRRGRACHARRGRRPRSSRPRTGCRRRPTSSTTTGCGSCCAPGRTCVGAAPGRAPARPRRRRPGAPRRAGRDEPASLGGAAAGDRRRLLHGQARPGADRLPRPGGDRGPVVGYPAYLEEGLIDAVLARGPVWRDPATGQRAVVAGRAADLRRTLRPTPVDGRRRRPKEDLMAAIAPDTTESAAPGWLGSFVETWEPGTGAPRRGPRAGDRPAHRDDPRLDARRRRPGRAPRRRPRSRPGPRPRYQERARILRRAAEIYEAHRAEFGTWTQRETGASHSKMHHESNFAYGEILGRGDAAVAALRLARADRPSRAAVDDPPRAGRGRRRDHAVELAERPGMRVVAPALALGNAVVLKPDPQTPVFGGAMFAAVFREAGLPDGLLQIVVGGADVGEALVTDPNIDVVSFTGSTAVGRRVGELAGGLLKKVVARARRQQRVHRPRRRRSRRGRGGRRLLVVPVPGPGLLRGRAPHRPRDDRRRVRRRR